MARAGTQRWRNPAPEGDDVQRSIELLDKVLSEYDEHEVEAEAGGCGAGGGAGVATTTTATTDCSSSTEPSIGLTPDDESPSLGHQSEDDGYMSMNGRKAKMALVALRPVPDCPEPQDSTGAAAQEFPPPPEEAERIISTLLPMVSPGNSSKRGGSQQQQQQSGRRGAGSRQQWMAAMEEGKRPAHAVTTQTTLPKTRHQRPYGWENGGQRVNQQQEQQSQAQQQQQQQYVVEPFRLAEPPSPPSKFASLPYDGKVSFNWIAPRSREQQQQQQPQQQPVDNGKKQSTEELRQSSEDGLDEEDEVDEEGDEEADVDEDDDEEDEEEEDDESNHPSPDKERAASAHNNHHHHHHHHHHPGSRRPPRQNEITKSSSVEDRLLMNNQHQQQQQQQGQQSSSNGSSLGKQQPQQHQQRQASKKAASGAGSSSSSARRRRNNSDSSESRFSRLGSESESRSSMPRSSSVSVDQFSMRANYDSSDFSRANSTSNERFHSDFSLAVASASSNDHVSVPGNDPFYIRNLDFSSFGLARAGSSERFSGRTSDRCSEERCSEVFSTRNSDFSTRNSTRNSTDFRTQSEEEHFSDDSLEELLPPPPALSKRHSIAWEVPLDDDPLYAPGSTKVVGRRRRKSSDVSSVGSASKLRDFDDWQDPRVSTTDDDLISPYSDSSTNELDQLRPQELSKNGTYVIRKGRKKERKQLPKSPSKSFDDEDAEDSRLTEVRRFSNTFDNIKSLLKENSKLEGLQEPGQEFGHSQAAISQPELAGQRAAADGSSERREKRRPARREPEPSEELEPSGEDQQPGDSEAEEPLKLTSFAERTRECNGFTITSSKSLDVSKAASLIVDEVPMRRSMNEQHRLETAKIPVNLLIEDQIVKKALNENRRQLEKVSDAIKEIESVKNSAEFGSSAAEASGSGKRNGDARMSYNKRFSLSKERPERKLLDVSEYDCRQPNRRQPPQPPPHASDVTDALLAKEKDSSFDRRRLNGEDIYSSGRRARHSDLENHKNDTKQIENVIDAILEDSKNPGFQVNVDVLEFPPLPPSPVEEADEESSDVGGSACNGNGPGGASGAKSKQGHTNRTMEYRPRVPPHRGISLDSSTKEHQTTSLNTRSMDAGYSRRRRIAAGMANARREVPVERRTLPTDLPGPSRHRPFTKRHSPSTEACSSGGSVGAGGSCSNGAGSAVGNNGSGMQTSCSLPETPVFARGSDIPRTPQHASGAAGTAGNPTQPRRQPGWYAPTTATTGYRRNNPGLEQAIIGTELLRLAGGPNRGWYPTRKSNQPRPASIEHLERLNSAYDARLPGAAEQRKPLTLPTNITPNKYFGQSKHSSTSSTREALRRVTSLLIKKGGGSKDGKNGKDNLSPSGPYAVVAGVEATDAPKKKGFFKNFWKRSRHYSLENQ